MGIKNLSRVLGDGAPGAVFERELRTFFGRRIAVDASCSLYQFIIAQMRMGDVSGLTDASGETTSHLQGMFYRTVKMMAHGIRPVFVFDGKPPTLKGGELDKRRERRDAAEVMQKAASEAGDAAGVVKAAKRSVRVTKAQNEEAKRLLRLLGMPVIEAPCEAEAQCAALARAGLVWATGSQDMDALTLGTPILIRNLAVGNAKKMPVKEVHLDAVLAGLGLTQAQFVDLCILLGCDYCDTIRGVGQVRALELIRRHGDLERVLDAIRRDAKFAVPDTFPFREVRALFTDPEVADPASLAPLLRWDPPDEDGVVAFLCKEKGFDETRVRNGLERLRNSRQTSVQDRLTSYFGAPVVATSSTADRKRALGAGAAAGGAAARGRGRGAPAKKRGRR